MLFYQQHYESASFVLEAGRSRHPEIRILPPIVGPWRRARVAPWPWHQEENCSQGGEGR
jgi:hypothetical protein